MEIARRMRALESAVFELPLSDFPPLSSPLRRRLPTSNINERIIKEMLRAGVCAPAVESEEARFWAKGNVCFCVSEEAKRRLRVILWTEVLNTRLRDWAEQMRAGGEAAAFLDLPKAGDVRAGAGAWSVALTDLSCAFFQYPIPEEFQIRFSFRTETGELYQLNRLPMGCSLSCHLLQLVTLTVAVGRSCPASTRVVGLPVDESEKPRTAAEVSCTVEGYIDNIRIWGERREVCGAFGAMVERARRLGVTLKESETFCFAAPPYEYKYLGGTVARKAGDEAGSIGVSERVRGEIMEFRGRVSEGVVCACWAPRVAGQIAWAAGLVALPLARWCRGLLGLRRAQNAYKRRGCVTVSFEEAEVCSLLELCDELSKERRVWAPAGPRTDLLWEVYTDASNSGHGTVIFGPEGELRSYGARWAAPEMDMHIVLLEAEAVRRGVCDVLQWAPMLEGGAHRLRLRCDNMPVVHAIRKGWSPSLELAQLVTEVRETLEAARVRWEITHVPTNENPADRPSRVFSSVPRK